MTGRSNVQDLPTSGVFTGIVGGSARVTRGSRVEVKGIVQGDLLVDAGATVLVSGFVKGRVPGDGADVRVTGIVG